VRKDIVHDKGADEGDRDCFFGHFLFFCGSDFDAFEDNAVKKSGDDKAGNGCDEDCCEVDCGDLHEEYLVVGCFKCCGRYKGMLIYLELFCTRMKRVLIAMVFAAFLIASCSYGEERRGAGCKSNVDCSWCDGKFMQTGTCEANPYAGSDEPARVCGASTTTSCELRYGKGSTCRLLEGLPMCTGELITSGEAN